MKTMKPLIFSAGKLTKILALIFFLSQNFVTANSGQQSGDALEKQISGFRSHFQKIKIFNRLDLLKDNKKYQSLSDFKQKMAFSRAFMDKEISKEMNRYSLGWFGVYSAGVGAGAIAGIAAFLSIKIENQQAMQLAGGLGVSMLGAGAFLCLEQLAYIFFPPVIQEREMILKYAEKKLFFKKSLQNYIEEEVFYDFWRNQDPSVQTKITRILEVALKLPITRKKLVYDEEKIRNSLSFFSKDIVHSLNLFALNEIAIQSFKVPLSTRYPIYLVGKPGTGKSYSVGQMAKAMGTSLSTINLDGASIDDIVGTDFNRKNARPGKILEAITSTVASTSDINYSNQILFIDEFDRLLLASDKKSDELLAFMLKLLDPDTRYFYSPYLKSKIRLPDTIILAGNFDIQELVGRKETLEALASRLEFVHFKGYSKEVKKRIFWEKVIPKTLASYQSSSEKKFQFDHLSKEEVNKINNFIEKDKDLGLRTCGKFISNMVKKSLLRQYRENNKS